MDPLGARSPSREQHVIGCECGTTLKLSTLNDDEAKTILALFDELHQGHERCTLEEAARIRHSERMRRRAARR